ncbi:MAG TPA: phosphoribosylamine--glycine ligase, partial [Candidatus Dormibacteraeota bacterium]|nr:phosphoribosylamine--glycine ligase [Candidatus Dormibacteraeota bacterium]
MNGSLHVLVVGSGAREHALAWAVARSPRCGRVFVAPGNGGTATVATNVAVAADDPAGILRAASEHSVGLVVVGPDAAVAAGVGDACRAAGIPVVGPDAAAGRIESSKEFAKELMDAAGIPTARWRSGGAEQSDALIGFAAELGGRCVVKADGLALGKGVTVCDTTAEAAAAIDSCLRDRRFGLAGERVVVEERLTGPEVSVLALTDGLRVRALVPACDYKRAGAGDTGPMTGGMGAYAPPAGVDVAALLTEAVETVVEPAVATLAERRTPYSGCLYAGLMLTADGLRVLEFNARFGDPEAQVVLPLLGEDVLELLLACAVRDLTPGRSRQAAEAAVGVVVAAAGYPGPPRTGDPVAGIDELDGDVLCFHAGTRLDAEHGDVRTAGGRVLTVVATDATVER